MSVNTETSSLKKEVSDYNSNGLSVGQATADKVGFFGTTPAIQPSSASQAAVSTTSITAVSTSSAIATSPLYGYATAAQADAIVEAVNALITRNAANYTLVNAIRSALVTLGIIKGSA